MNNDIQLFISGPECPTGLYIGLVTDYYYDTFDGVLTLQSERLIYSQLKRNEKNTLYIINNRTNVMHTFNNYELHSKRGGPNHDDYRILFSSYEEDEVEE